MKDRKVLQRSDFVRAFFSFQFVASIALGVGVCYFTLLFCGDYQSTTVHKFIFLHDKSQSFLAYLVGVLPFGLCLYEDFQYGNIRNVVGRIPLAVYLRSKMAAAVFSAIVAFVLGKLMFVVFYSGYNEICRPETLTQIPRDILYFSFLENGQNGMYFLMTSLHKALYCGILCQIVMLVSLAVQNKAAVLSIPMAVFYILNFYINSRLGIMKLNFTRIFDGITRLWSKDIYGSLYVLIMAAISYYILYRLAFWLLKKKVYDD